MYVFVYIHIYVYMYTPMYLDGAWQPVAIETLKSQLAIKLTM